MKTAIKTLTIILCAVSILSAFQMCLAQSQAQTIIASSGTITPITPKIYAKIDFSTGDLSQIKKLGGITDDPPIATCSITTEITRVGKYAMICNQTNPAASPGTSNRAKAVLSDLGNLHLTEVYYGLSVYLPTSLKPTRWTQIFEAAQYDPRNGTWPHIAQLQVCTTNGQLHLYIVKNEYPPTNYLWTSKEPVPQGKWIDLVIYIKVAEDGEIKLWQDGSLVADVHYNTAISGLQSAIWPEFGLYQDTLNDPGNYVVDGRFIAANTYELASTID